MAVKPICIFMSCVVCSTCCRSVESVQEVASTPPPLATVMKDKAKMDTEVKLQGCTKKTGRWPRESIRCQVTRLWYSRIFSENFVPNFLRSNAVKEF